MSEHKQKNKNEDYIDVLKGWQDHQYDPGYYTGGRIHPLFKNPGRPKLFGIFIIALSFLFSIPFVIIIVRTVSSKSMFRPEDVFFFSIFVVLFAGILILQVIGGIRRIKASKKKRKHKK